MWRTWCRTLSQDLRIIIRSTQEAYSFYQHLPQHIPFLTCASPGDTIIHEAQAYLESIEDAAEQSYPHLCVLKLCMHKPSMHA